jgi:hypothetical protein
MRPTAGACPAIRCRAQPLQLSAAITSGGAWTNSISTPSPPIGNSALAFGWMKQMSWPGAPLRMPPGAKRTPKRCRPLDVVLRGRLPLRQRKPFTLYGICGEERINVRFFEHRSSGFDPTRYRFWKRARREKVERYEHLRFSRSSRV